MKTIALSFIAIGVLGGCASGGIAPRPVPALDEVVSEAAGLAPIEAQLQYHANPECLPPEWASTHPNHEGGAWPTFRPASVANMVRSHDVLGDVTDVIVVREPHFTEGLETEAPHLLLFSTWGGTDFPCGGAPISEATIVRSLVDPGQQLSRDELFTAISQQTDADGIVPLTDLDVALF